MYLELNEQSLISRNDQVWHPLFTFTAPCWINLGFLSWDKFGFSFNWSFVFADGSDVQDTHLKELSDANKRMEEKVAQLEAQLRKKTELGVISDNTHKEL